MSQLYAPTQGEKGLKTLFLTQLAAEQTFIDMIATRVGSGDADEKYTWLGQPVQMEELTDDGVQFNPVSDTGYSLTNKTYVSGMAVGRNDFRDDQTGGIAFRIRQQAQRAARHPNKLLIAALTDGTSENDYTGEAFFNATHAIRNKESSTQSNIVTGTGTTTAQVSADLSSAIARMASFEDEAGEPFDENIMELTVVAPYDGALRTGLLEATGAAQISNTTNVQFDGMEIKILFTSRLNATDTNDYYVLNTGSIVKPLVFQEREPLEMQSRMEGSDADFFHEQFLFKARSRYVAGYAFWQNAVKVTNT